VASRLLPKRTADTYDASSPPSVFSFRSSSLPHTYGVVFLPLLRQDVPLSLYVFCHCPFEVHSPAICSTLYEKVKALTPLSPLPWQPDQPESGPEQARLFEPGNYELGAGNVLPSICSNANRKEGGTG
jgi:hypothetical protein